jgi:hypothetical protein
MALFMWINGAASQTLKLASIISWDAQDLQRTSEICIECFVLAFVTLQMDSSEQFGS